MGSATQLKIAGSFKPFKSFSAPVKAGKVL